MRKKVLVLGSKGLLGTALLKELNSTSNLDLIHTSRSLNWGVFFDPNSDNFEELFDSIRPNYVVNCLGIVKQRILSGHESLRSLVRVNSLFPHEIAELCEINDSKLIQVGTDCVFSGSQGSYDENSIHDGTDLYGKTKSLGEPDSANSMIIRSSFIGPEIENKLSFYEWVKNFPANSEISGYTDHLWNGISSTTLSRLIVAIIKNEEFRPGVQHLVPLDVVNKFELINFVISKIQRSDLQVNPVLSNNPVDRTLTTLDQKRNQELWEITGFKNPPTIRETIDEIN